MKNVILVAGTLCLAVVCLGQTPAQVAPSAPVLKGCVIKEGTVDPGTLPVVRTLAKIAATSGEYRATLEAEGVTLSALLEKAEVKKKVNDGFGRPLDTFVVVTGRSGQRALFSWGELFARGDTGPVLAERLRLRVPSHHEAIDAKVYPATLFDAPVREKLDLKSCQACHEGPKPARLDMPRGFCLVVPEDGFGGRFVEDVVEIRVEQVGITVQADKESGKKTPDDAFVAAPVLVGRDGKTVEVGAEKLAGVARRQAADATIGMGRGFHGVKKWDGVDLGEAIRALLPGEAIGRDVWVLVTALDGYRSLYSGSEVFAPRRGEGVLLADRENGEPLGPGSGRCKTVATGDFFIDRGVRLVKEIRVGSVAR